MSDCANNIQQISCPRCDYRIPVRPDLIDYKSAYEDYKDMCKRLNEERITLSGVCQNYKVENERMLSVLKEIVEASEDGARPYRLGDARVLAKEILKEEE